MAQKEQPPVTESQPKAKSGNNSSKDKSPNTREKNDPPAERLTPSLDKIEAAIRDLITQQNAAQGQGPSNNEIRDLKAQEGMALWAQAMFWATVAAVIVTFLGIVLIKKTLGETRRAANYTEGMLEEAKKTTVAAEKSVEITRETAKRQLRAYVSARPIFAYSFDNKSFARVRYQIENAGQTPAHKLRHIANVGIFPSPLPADFTFPRLDADERASTVLFHKWPWLGTAYASDIFSDEEIANFRTGDARMYIWGVVHYEDVFEEPHTTTFAASLIASFDVLEKLTSTYEPEDLKIEFQTTGAFNAAT